MPELFFLGVSFTSTEQKLQCLLSVEGQTSVTVVINEDDLLQQDGRCGLQDTMNGPQQGGPGLVVEGYDHRGGR